MKLFASFTKSEEQDDGTIIVEGIASTESVDAQGEIVKSSAMEAALPDYMRHGTGALREMHQPLAAGTAMASVADGVTTVKAHVVDPVAIKKVQTGTYKGFSIGGKVTARDSLDKNTITGIKLVEISLVDRPANPDAVCQMWKAEDLDETEIVADDTVAKSLWDVVDLASVLAQLKSLQVCAAWDAAYEGDAGTAAAKLKDAVTMLAGILVEMVGEEIKEDDVAMAEKPGDVAKGDEPAVVVEPPVVEPAIVEPPVAKLEPTDMAKVEELVAKAVASALEPLTKANADLTAEVTALKAQPAAPRGAVMAVGKSDAIEAPKGDEIEPVLKSDGSIDELATEIKKVQQGGLL